MPTETRLESKRLKIEVRASRAAVEQYPDGNVISMSALLKPTEPSNPDERRPATSRRPQRYRRSAASYRALAMENLLKVSVNGLLSVAAVAALSDLLPYLQSNRVKLREIRAQVHEAQLQVEQLRTQFSNTFDPRQAHSVMQEQSAKIARNQRRVIWLNKEKPESAEGIPHSSESPLPRKALLEPEP